MDFNNRTKQGNDAGFLKVWKLFFLLFSINVVLFAWYVANPLPISDNWFFIDTFVRKMYGGSLSIDDFFRKRMASDHAQPLQKLMLYLHVRLFSMDFLFDAIVSMVVGLFTVRWLVFWLLQNNEILEAGEQSFFCSRDAYLRNAVLIAIPFSLFSMNVTTAYYWPLVGQFFITFPFILYFCVALSISLEKTTVQPNLIAATFFLVFLLDTLGMICAAAGLLYCGLSAVKYGSWRRMTVPVCVIVITGGLARSALLALTPDVTMGSPMPSLLGQNFSYLLTHWKDIGYWATIPATASIMQPYWIHSVLGDGYANGVGTVIGIFVLTLHYWFWRSWWLTQKSKISTLAALLMLFAYISLAAIIFFRVPDLGFRGLEAPRYVVSTYQITIMALLAMLFAKLNEKKGQVRSKDLRLVVTGVLLGSFLALQLVYVFYGWGNVKYMRNYQAIMAAQLINLSTMAETASVQCLPGLNVCSYTGRKRTDVIGFLMKNQLSIFSPTFQKRHPMPPSNPTLLK